jgi:glycosyltransferase involved in cell wall biosynthesis
MRVFVFSSRTCQGEVGGSGGVNYKLFLSNKEYNLIDDMYHIFDDIVLTKNSPLHTVRNTSKKNKVSKITEFIKNIYLKLPFLNSFLYELKLKKLRKYYTSINKNYNFSENDFFIFHDIESTNAFSKLFHFSNTLLVYHQQGALYYEWKGFRNIINKSYEKYLNQKLTYSYKNIQHFGFPSYGAKQSLLQTGQFLKDIVNAKKAYVFYNGFDSRISISSRNEIITEITKNKTNNTLYFTSVAVLNEAKGADQIPLFLGTLKKRYGNFKWIHVGDGVLAPQFQHNVEKYELQSNLIWIKEKIDHDSVLSLFSISDFYIMFHRHSIFDYATIEAMSYGNIPVLSNLGGNIEVIVDDNGFLINDLHDVSMLYDFINSNQILEYKKLNSEIQKQHFSSYAFLKRYAEFIEKHKSV